MFDESYEKLDVNETASIIDVINKQIEGSIFDPLETTIMAIDVPFYKHYRFLDIADHATNPPLQRYVFQKKKEMDFTIVDWGYKTIYELNAKASLKLDDKNIFEYVRFFFNHVKGRYGKFILCESSDNVVWKDEPIADVKMALNKTIKPLELVEKRKDGVFHLKAYMMLKDALFIVDVYVNKVGSVTMSDHEILMEDIPVLDSVVGQ